MESKTAQAAAKAVAKGQKSEKHTRSNDEILSDIRKNLAAGLAVTPDDIRFLLTAYDASSKQAAEFARMLEAKM